MTAECLKLSYLSSPIVHISVFSVSPLFRRSDAIGLSMVTSVKAANTSERQEQIQCKGYPIVFRQHSIARLKLPR
jgi:hypothetical protein